MSCPPGDRRLSFKTLFFGSDPAQALRIKRLVLACATYACGFAIFGFVIATGLASGESLVPLAVSLVAINASFYAILRSGLNRRLIDPGITIPQMVAGTLVITYMLYHAPQARGAFLLTHMLVLLFGIFRLHASSMLLVGVIAVAAYAGVIMLDIRRGISADQFAVDLLQLMVLAFLYPWFAQLGAHLNRTRADLRRANFQLKRTLADHKQLLDQIRIQATHDDLTGLHNRRHLMSVMEIERERQQRGGPPYSVLVLDIDHFKAINDRYGHQGGDRVLVKFAEVVQAALRSIDHFGRYGGEEFLVVLPQTELEAARAAARRIRAAVEATPFPDVGQALTVSIGVACAAPGEHHDKVFSRADRALYSAKQNGRNCVECHETPEVQVFDGR